MKVSKKVLIVAPFARWTPHLETDLEIIQRCLDDGHELTVLVCHGNLPVCRQNRYHDLNFCLHCMGRIKHGLSLIKGTVHVKPLLNLTARDKHEIKALKIPFNSIDELKLYHIDNFDIGWAVLSSIVDFLREPQMDFNNRHVQNLIRRFLRSALAVYRSVGNYLSKESFDEAYVFNGRMAILRAIFRAYQKAGIRCFTHDRGCDFNHFDLFENSLRHDVKKTVGRIHNNWQKGDPQERVKIGGMFYEERAAAVQQSWYSFVEGQSVDMLPENWRSDIKNIVVFTSSEDEFIAIGDLLENALYSSQQEGLQQILFDLRKNGFNGHVYVRMHPNLKKVNARYVKKMKAIRMADVTVIHPESKVSSYALLRNSDRVLTFGSTVGIEAVYFGKPSILAGPSFYKALGSTYNPESHEELMGLLLCDALPPKSKEGALKYGFYQKTRGEKFKYYVGHDVTNGFFKGQRIKASWPYNILAGRYQVLRWPLRFVYRNLTDFLLTR